MLRLPPFHYVVPGSLAEAVAAKARFGAMATYVAGGTDLLPKMKRRQREPEVLVQVGHLPELRGVATNEEGTAHLGAATTLASLSVDAALAERWPAVVAAAAQVANPVVRNMATLGGNLCLETRCSFFDQSREWREAISFCLKLDGDTCRVAESSDRCWAIQSSDLAPLMVALGACIELRGPAGVRTIDAASFYKDDGIAFLTKTPDELVTRVSLPFVAGTAATYVKVSRRPSFDFPVLSVAAWVRREAPQGPVLEARVVLGAVGSAPVVVPGASDILGGRPLNQTSIDEVAEAARRAARPLDNADLTALWRKRVVQPYVVRALQQLVAARPAR